MKKTPDPADNGRFPVLKVLILVTCLALAAFSWYAFSHWLRADDDITWYPPEQTACNLHEQRCVAPLGERGSVALSVAGSGRIKALEPLALTVAVEGIVADGATVDLVGRGMDMGLNRFVLDADGSGHFSGQGQVGVCTQDVMPWRARVILDTPNGRVGSWFDFDVVRS
ncbi:MAG: hypothetical protein L0I84_03315 [Halomonas subglaciescola]|nr:hypothetical protein [Halomonas subglaciescola]